MRHMLRSELQAAYAWRLIPCLNRPLLPRDPPAGSHPAALLRGRVLMGPWGAGAAGGAGSMDLRRRQPQPGAQTQQPAAAAPVAGGGRAGDCRLLRGRGLRACTGVRRRFRAVCWAALAASQRIHPRLAVPGESRLAILPAMFTHVCTILRVAFSPSSASMKPTSFELCYHACMTEDQTNPFAFFSILECA